MPADRFDPPVETLLVDDVERLRRMVADELRAEAAFQVVGEAANGVEAIEQAKMLEPDLVLLDLSMPRMGGLEALTELRRQVPGASVVVLSGYTSERMAAVARDQGALDYIEKGIEPQRLVDRLYTLVGEDPPPKEASPACCPQAGAPKAEVEVCLVGLDPSAAKRLRNGLGVARPGWTFTHATNDAGGPAPEGADVLAVAIGDCSQRWEPTVRSLSSRFPEVPCVVAVPEVPEGCLGASLEAGAAGVLEMDALDADTLATQIRWAMLEEERQRSRTRRLEMLAGTMAHDLRGPLRALDRYADWIREGRAEGDPERVETAIEGVQDGVERARRLIESQLTYARLQTKPPAAERTDPHEPLREVLAELEDRIERSGADVTVGELPEVIVPPEHVAELFRNLLSNAIKYREEGQDPHVEVHGELDGGQAAIRVRDDGIGIAPEHQEEIFDPFSRLHAEQDYPGTGLGLAICEQIVEQWAGSIEVDAAPGVGTTMTVRLPSPSSR